MRVYSFNAYRNSFKFKALRTLLGAYGILFVFIQTLSLWFNNFAVEKFLSLSGTHVREGHIWTLLTYSFLHGNFWHLFFNSIGIFFLGEFLLKHEFELKGFLFLFLGGIISGALFWLAINIRTEFSLIGASAGLMALLIYFCQTYPDKSLTLLLFFFLPITLRAKWIGYGLWLYEILQCLFQEIPQLSTIASSAHLGGMVFGLLFFKAKMWLESQPATPKKEFKGHYTVHLGSNTDKKEEKLEEILKKMHFYGFGSLSAEEKEFLERYRDKL